MNKNKTKLIINNKIIYIDNNQTILQTCEKIGLYIPRFCYNETSSIAGNCRMCLIEIEKTPKLMPACAIKIVNDMKIYTKTNLIKKTRESILEFLSINHPLDCPICDQGGECDSQDQALIYGSDKGRYYEYKRSIQDKNTGPLIKTIMTRCIHCTRCIRYVTEIAGIEIYGTTGRGKNMEIGTYINNLFKSEISGNVIDSRPVGALTSKPYAFKVRPWELKSIETIDILDSLGTNIRIDIKGIEIMRILPKINDKINQQWISDKTRYSYDGLKCQRIYYPMLKNNKFITISWQKIIKIIINKIGNEKNNNKISGIIGNYIDKETILIFKKLLNKLGINNLYVELTDPLIKINTNINYDLRHNYLSNFNDIKNIDMLLLINSNIRYEASMLNIKLRQLIIKKKNININVLLLGSNLNLTYNNKQIGNNLKILYLIANGINKYTIKILNTLNPLCIISYNILERIDGNTLYFILKEIFIKWIKLNNKKLNNLKLRYLHTIYKKIKHIDLILYKKNNYTRNIKNNNEYKQYINILHDKASLPNSLDLGFCSINKNITYKLNKLNNFNIIYSLGADYIKNIYEKINNYVIYQGHHGCYTAKKANIIIPSLIYIEKIGTYMNTEGYIQKTKIVLNNEQDIYNDWIILKNIAFYLNLNEINNYIKDFGLCTNQNYPNIIKLLNIKKNKQLQIILNTYLNNLFNKSIIKENKNINVSNNKYIYNNNLLYDDIKYFKNITPNNINKQIIYPNLLNIKNKKLIYYNTQLIYNQDNFYISDIITKSSLNMGKCSSIFKNNNY